MFPAGVAIGSNSEGDRIAHPSDCSLAMPPKLSVVVRCYNQLEYISECLDSILTQDVDFPYEVVICDDCSTDGTRAVIEQYGERYPEIVRVLPAIENIGAMRTYFRAHNAARGQYVAHMDGDDIMLPGKLQRQVNILDANPDCVLVNHRARYFSDDGSYECDTGKLGDGSDLIFYTQAEQARWGIIAVHSSYMYRASARKVREYTEEVMEWYFTMDYLSEPGKVGCFINSVLVNYRCNNAGASYTASRKGRDKAYRVHIKDVIGKFNGLLHIRRDLYAHALLNITTYHANVKTISPRMIWFLLRNAVSFDASKVMDAFRVRRSVAPQKRIR